MRLTIVLALVGFFFGSGVVAPGFVFGQPATAKPPEKRKSGEGAFIPADQVRFDNEPAPKGRYQIVNPTPEISRNIMLLNQ